MWVHAESSSGTSEGGRTVLRFCTINPRTTFEEIEATIERMERVGAEPA